MRALFVDSLKVQDSYQIENEPLHHLVNVIRIQESEELLLLNGRGLGILTRVNSISKRLLKLNFIQLTNAPSPLRLDLALGIPKKDSLDLCLKQATELGISRIFLVRGQYSQGKIPEPDRLHNLLISALEQANSFYLPQVIESSWENLPWSSYSSVLLMDSRPKTIPASPSGEPKASRLLIVGPEGGFSIEELSFFHSKIQVESLHLPTPILRTSTAVATGIGVMLQRLMD